MASAAWLSGRIKWLAAKCLSSNGSQIMEGLKQLRRMRKFIQAFLVDAEEREISDSRTRVWLDALRGVALDAEDVIQGLEYESLQYQLACHEDNMQAFTALGEEGGLIKKKREVSESPPPDPSFQLQIVTLTKRASDLFDDEIHKDASLNAGRPLDAVLRCPFSFLAEKARVFGGEDDKREVVLVDKARVFGREDDKREVVKMLLDVLRPSHMNVSMVSVVGMGGVGKTTLAQLVYGDDEVVNHFEVRLWVCVSDDFDVARLTGEILANILHRPVSNDSLPNLQLRLAKELAGKRFLLVLDDAWNERRVLWGVLTRPLFDSGAEGSRVLITTRSSRVSKTSGVSEKNTYRLGCLSYADSWSLFEKHAFKYKSSGDYPNLVPIGQQIVRKCGGLPLAVIQVARVLCTCEDDEHTWEQLSRSELFELAEVKEGILSALKLSYYHLSLGTKPCFAYCAGFPKEHNFGREELVLLWMAQGYIIPGRSMETIGRRYFDELLDKSFFEDYGVGCFKMHDLIHQLARSISRGECSHLESGGELSNRGGMEPMEPRHIWFAGEAGMTRLLTGQVMDNLQHLRTLYMIGKSRHALSSKVLDDMFLQMRYLRALDLGAAEISDQLPDSIGGLKFLRYLSISGRQLRRLPDSLGNLLYLQTLIVRRAHSLEELPMCLIKLVDFRYLILHKF